MLKDYANQIYALGMGNQSVFNFYSDAFNYLNDYPFFTSYSAARTWCKHHVVGCFIKAQNRVDLVSDNKVVLFDGLYFVLPHLAKQEFLAMLKKGLNSFDEDIRFNAFIDYTSNELARDGVNIPKNLFNEVKK